MNNMFLQHLKSITPQGKAEERKMFIPADVIKKEIEDAEQIRELDSIEELNEAISRNDPNRGGANRAKPKLPYGQDPYDMYSKGMIKPYDGKLQKRLRAMSDEDRQRYYREIGMRSRAASRGGKTQRLHPLSESGFKKGIRVSKALNQKSSFGRSDLAKRDAALLLKAYSRVRKLSGMDPRITVPAHKYKPSDNEYAEMQRHAMLALRGKNRN